METLELDPIAKYALAFVRQFHSNGLTCEGPEVYRAWNNRARIYRDREVVTLGEVLRALDGLYAEGLIACDEATGMFGIPTE